MTAPVNTTFTTGTTITSNWLNGVNDAINDSTQDITGAVPRTLPAKLSDTVSVKDFGAVGDGVTDDTAAIQAAINYATSLTSKAVVHINANCKITGTINVTCDIDGSGGQLNIYTNGKFLFNTSYVKAENLTFDVKSAGTFDVIKVTVAHVKIINPSIFSDIGVTAKHTAINIEPPSGGGLWDVRIVRPYIRQCGTGVQFKSTGWITACSVTEGTIIAFANYGVKFDDSSQAGLIYCTVSNCSFENINVDTTTKTAIHLEGYSHVIDNISDFNDDALMGSYYTVVANDPVLEGYIATNNGPNIANHAMQFTSNKLSNIHAEGDLDLNYLRNLYKLDNIHIAQKVGITTYQGYTYAFDYSADHVTYDIDLANVTTQTANPSDATITKAVYDLNITMNANAYVIIKQVFPKYLIEASNKAAFVTVAVTTDILDSPNVTIDKFEIRSGSTNLPISVITPSTNLRVDNHLIVYTLPLEGGLQLTNGDYFYIELNGQNNDTYKVSCIRAYSNLINPVADVAPYLVYLS